jgi:endonuclease-3
MEFGCSAMVAPPWIAEIESARIGQGTDGRAADTTDDRARARIPGQRADRRARACAQKAAGKSAVFGRRTASRERKQGAGRRRCSEILRGSHFIPRFGSEVKTAASTICSEWSGLLKPVTGFSLSFLAEKEKMPRKFTIEEVSAFFSRFQAREPDPRSELEYKNPYTLLVAVVLSAQATDKGVNRATAHLFPTIDTPEKMVAFGEDRLREAIKTIGLFRTKAKNVIALSKTLLEQHGGKVPPDRELLQALPGVGRKTANVVLNVAFGEPTIAVDTHIFRVCNRTNLAPGKNPREVEDRLERIVPERFKLHAHHWLILHGRYICIARKPRCPDCIVADLCRYKPKTQPPGVKPQVETKFLKARSKTSRPRAR